MPISINNQTTMDDLNFPICILKMNLQCCEDLPSRIKKLLRKVKGVYTITIDPVKSMIIVCGIAEPQILIKAVERIGQTPQLYAYERDPSIAKTRFGTLLKRLNKEREIESPPVAASTPTPGACPVGGDTGRDFGYFGPPRMMQMPLFTLPRTVRPPGWLAQGSDRPKVMVKYEHPEVMTRKPPAPYPHDFYESKGFPATDSLFNYFSDDHAQPCTIM